MTENTGEEAGFAAGLVRGLWEGVWLPFAGARVLWRSGRARRQALYPLIANCVVYLLVLALALWLIGKVNLDPVAWDFWWGIGKALAAAVNYLLPVLKWLICVPVLLIICFFTFSFVGMLIASPFNDMLSETIEGYLTGREAAGDFSLKLTAHAMLVSLCSTLRILCKQGLCALICLPLLLIPFAGAALMFLVMAYFTGLGFLDIGMARNNLRYPHKMAAAGEQRWVLVGMGVGMQFLLMIPLLNLLVLPLGVAGGTLLYCRLDWRELLRRHELSLPERFTPPVCAGQTPRV